MYVFISAQGIISVRFIGTEIASGVHLYGAMSYIGGEY